jgi:hypothetical protein
LTRQGIVYVYRLHEAKSRYHQHEDQRRPFPEQQSAELGVLLHGEG